MELLTSTGADLSFEPAEKPAPAAEKPAAAKAAPAEAKAQ